MPKGIRLTEDKKAYLLNKITYLRTTTCDRDIGRILGIGYKTIVKLAGRRTDRIRFSYGETN